jgi:lipid-A-disaccharide synthase
MKILMMAGEVSGDYQGSFLARALQARQPGIELLGTGGGHMQSAGVDLRHETAHLSSVGFLEPVRHLLPLKGIYRDIRQLVHSGRPDIAVLIDNPGFNLAVGKVLHELGVPVIYYFPPQIWVGPFLFARNVARISRLVISAFPRESRLYRSRYGANAVSYGHPLLDIVRPSGDPVEALRARGLDPDRPVVALMPGSRTQEIRELAPVMIEAAKVIQARHPRAQILLPVASPHLVPQIRAILRDAGMEGRVTVAGGGDNYTCLSRCNVVLACSGTATLELALLRVPMIVAYRLDPLSHWVARKLAMTPFVAMPNVLLDDWVVPEVMQDSMNPANLAAAALEMLEQPERAAALRERLAEVPRHLGAPGAVDRAAERIIAEASGLAAA